MDRLAGHYIVCGYGNVGRAVVDTLVKAGHKVVVIDSSSEELLGVQGPQIETVPGKASDKEVLERAHLERAAGLVACVGSDAENLYILLAARKLRPDLRLGARASDSSNRDRLVESVDGLLATSPYEAAGRELVDLVLSAPTESLVPSSK